MVGVDRVGERRELRQVMELSDAFRDRRQVAPSLPLHAVASLIELPDRALLALVVIHRVVLSLSGFHRAEGRPAPQDAWAPRTTQPQMAICDRSSRFRPNRK